MRQAGLAPDEIDHIVAHGTSTPLNDVTETRAIKAAFGEQAYRIADLVAQVDGRPHARRGRRARRRSPRSGRSATAGSPPTINYHEPDPDCDLDYVPNVKRQARVETAMINGFGFGGQNAVAIFRRFEA